MYGRNTLNDKLFHLYYKAYGENSVYDSELMYNKLMILPKISFMTLRYRNCRYNSITENFILSILIY